MTDVWVRKCDSFEEDRRADREFWQTMSPDARVVVLDDLRRQWAKFQGAMTKDFEELFECLRRRNVKALVVGGYAVAFHGRPRFTKDIDVFVEPSAENAERLLAALADFGFGGLGLTQADFALPGKIVQLGVAPNRIDLLTAIDGVTFDEAWSGRVPGHYGAESVHYIGRAELIRNKRASARPQDLLDLTDLSPDESPS